jgi:HSP20 family molecular chaperone IbpA
MPKKQSFFERLTGSVKLEDDFEDVLEETPVKTEPKGFKSLAQGEKDKWAEEEEEEEGQLTVDVYQNASDIYVETMVAGVRPEDVQIHITRDMITIRGKREQARTINDEDFFTRELYWGAFSRTISLPAEVEAEEAEAIERHGLLVIRLPKINKDKQTHLKVKSV